MGISACLNSISMRDTEEVHFASQKLGLPKLFSRQYRFHQVCKHLLVVIGSLTILNVANPAVALGRGDTGSEVALLQDNLRNANFFTGESTGVYGEETEMAVRELQRSLGLAVDGIAGPATLLELQNRFIGSHNQELQRETLRDLLNRDFPSGTVDTFLDGISNDLSALQTELSRRGIYTGAIDGIYGPLTETAIIRYAFETLLPNRRSDVLELGSTGPLVERLQQQLGQLGYYHGGIDGVFGSETEAAVINFQRDASLTIDGRVGSATDYGISNFNPGPRAK